MAQFPWPRDRPSFLRQKEATGDRRSAGPPSLQTAPAPAADARRVFSPPPPTARSSVLRLSPGHALSIASLLLCGCFPRIRLPLRQGGQCKKSFGRPASRSPSGSAAVRRSSPGARLPTLLQGCATRPQILLADPPSLRPRAVAPTLRSSRARRLVPHTTPFLPHPIVRRSLWPGPVPRTARSGRFAPHVEFARHIGSGSTSQ